jgi:hypothetical protein
LSDSIEEEVGNITVSTTPEPKEFDWEQSEEARELEAKLHGVGGIISSGLEVLAEMNEKEAEVKAEIKKSEIEEQREIIKLRDQVYRLEADNKGLRLELITSKVFNPSPDKKPIEKNKEFAGTLNLEKQLKAEEVNITDCPECSKKIKKILSQENAIGLLEETVSNYKVQKTIWEDRVSKAEDKSSILEKEKQF